MANIPSRIKISSLFKFDVFNVLLLSRAVFLNVITKEDAFLFGKTELFYSVLKHGLTKHGINPDICQKD